MTRPLRSYLLLVFFLSAPLWVAAQFLDATRIIPVRLPLSALQFLAVLVAALHVTRREGGSARALLARGIDFARIPSLRWRVGVFLLMPVIVWISYGVTLACGLDVSRRWTPLLSVPVFLVVYGVSGYCEQLGWTAIMTDALLVRRSVTGAGLLTGVAWAAWHVIPFLQTHNAPSWIAWQCLFSVVYRVLLTRAYIATNRSVFATVALHATYNTGFSLLPYFGSSYRPMFMLAVTLVPVILLSVRRDEGARVTGSSE